jgi:hypothetical protein
METRRIVGTATSRPTAIVTSPAAGKVSRKGQPSAVASLAAV